MKDQNNKEMVVFKTNMQNNSTSCSKSNVNFFTTKPGTVLSENFQRFEQQVFSTLDNIKTFDRDLFLELFISGNNSLSNKYLKFSIKESNCLDSFIEKICNTLTRVLGTVVLTCDAHTLMNFCFMLCYHDPLLCVFLKTNMKKPKSDLEKRFLLGINTAIETLEVSFVNSKY